MDKRYNANEMVSDIETRDLILDAADYYADTLQSVISLYTNVRKLFQSEDDLGDGIEHAVGDAVINMRMAVICTVVNILRDAGFDIVRKEEPERAS